MRDDQLNDARRRTEAGDLADSRGNGERGERERGTGERGDGGESRLEVQSVRRACQLLDALAIDPGTAQSALDLARSTGLNRTVVHRLLRTLQLDGLVADVGNGRYKLGSTTVGLGMRYLDGLGIRRAALPYAISLHSSIETAPWIVSVAVRAGDYAVLVERLWKPEAPLDSLMDLGTHMPLRTSAAGRCLLAYASPPFDGAGEEPELAARLQEVRDAGGIEVSSNELIRGMSAIAAAIVPREHAVGALIVSGLDLEPQLARDSDVAERLRRAATAIAGVLR